MTHEHSYQQLPADRVSGVLALTYMPPRQAVAAANSYTAQLLGEHYVDPRNDMSFIRRIGHDILVKTGQRKAMPHHFVEQPGKDDVLEQGSRQVAFELQKSREYIKSSITEGVDDVVVDEGLGIGKQDGILPHIFRQAHTLAQKQEGKEFTFLKWMTDYATDEQLLNVWQWHDTYLNELDKDPAFIERITSLKKEFEQGVHKAIANGTLHPDMTTSSARLNKIEIVHSSPFAPRHTTTNAYANAVEDRIYIKDTVSDFTLYHELTHINNGGLSDMINEGATDIIAAAIYNTTRPRAEHVDVLGRAYGPQVAIIQALERLAGKENGVYELSRAYGSPDFSANTWKYIGRLDKAIGMPLGKALLLLNRDLDKYIAGARPEVAVRFVQDTVKEAAELLVRLTYDDKGHKVAYTVDDLERRFSTPGVLSASDTAKARYILNFIHSAENEQQTDQNA